MTEAVCVVELPAEVGMTWVAGSLADGGQVSREVLAAGPFRGGAFAVIAPPGLELADANSLNQMNRIPHPQRCPPQLMTRVLEGLAAAGRLCLVVEDVLRAPDDPQGPFGNTSVLGDTVIHWLDLPGASARVAIDMMATSDGNYLLNAFVSTRPSEMLGLVKGRQAPRGLGRSIAESLAAAIVLAFDGESYAFWLACSPLSAGG